MITNSLFIINYNLSTQLNTFSNSALCLAFSRYCLSYFIFLSLSMLTISVVTLLPNYWVFIMFFSLTCSFSCEICRALKSMDFLVNCWTRFFMSVLCSHTLGHSMFTVDSFYKQSAFRLVREERRV